MAIPPLAPEYFNTPGTEDLPESSIRASATKTSPSTSGITTQPLVLLLFNPIVMEATIRQAAMLLLHAIVEPAIQQLVRTRFQEATRLHAIVATTTRQQVPRPSQ